MTGGVYGVTLLLGAVEGLLGSFEFSRGPAPAVSLACCAAILATCLLVGWTTRSLGGAVAPAVGWIVVSFVLATPDVQGSVVVTASTAGRWFLYGGAASAALAAVISFVLWVVLLPAGSDR